MRSHQAAKDAHEKGYFSDIVSVRVPGKPGSATKSVDRDNGVRVSTAEQMSKLKPAFVKPSGNLFVCDF